jgi:hypothetical protein
VPSIAFAIYSYLDATDADLIERYYANDARVQVRAIKGVAENQKSECTGSDSRY